MENSAERDTFLEYKKSIEKRVEKADEYINQLLLENQQLVNENKLLRSQLDTLGGDSERLRDDLVKKTEHSAQLAEKDLILKDFLEHFINLRIHSITSSTTSSSTTSSGTTSSGTTSSGGGATSEESSVLGSGGCDEIVFDLSHSNSAKTVIIDYKLIVRSTGSTAATPEKSGEETTVIYVPLLKHRSVQELTLLQEKLPAYMLDTIQFSLTSLSKFYMKLNKYLHK